MLRDRKILVEQEITKLTDKAAHQYLEAVTTQKRISDDYQYLHTRITELQHERKMIQLLLDKGHE